MRILTIGHGARTFDHFVATLHAGSARGVIDVRRFPGSRRHPHFGRDTLPSALAPTHTVSG